MNANDLLGIRATFERVALALERDGITGESIERLMAWGTVTFGRTLTRTPEASQVPWVAINFHAHIGIPGLMIQGEASGANACPLLVRVVRGCVETALAYEKGYERERLDAAYELGEEWVYGSRQLTQEDRDVRLPSVLRTLDAAARYGKQDQARVLAISLRETNMAKWHVELGACRKCGTPLDGRGFCRDETCPYSDRAQDAPYTED